MRGSLDILNRILNQFATSKTKTHMASTSLKKVFSLFSLVGYVVFIDNCCNVVFS